MNKKGVSIIAAIGIVLILSVLGLVGVSLLGSVSNSVSDYLRAQRAFYIAEAGARWYLQQLKIYADAGNNWTAVGSSTDLGPKNFAGGTFSITVSNCQIDDVDILSVGIMTGYQNQQIKRQVAMHAHKKFTTTGFEYALYVKGDVHSQGAEGFTVNGKQITNATDFPSVDYPYYQSISTPGQIISGNHIFNAGTYSGIWFIDGNVEIKSNVTINGTIITTGNIDMTGSNNVTINAVLPYPALVSDGNFLFQNASNIYINGLVYVGADLSANFLSQKADNINFFGSIFIAGNFNLQNSEDIVITYNPAIIDNPPPGFYGGPGGTNVIISNNWQEVH